MAKSEISPAQRLLNVWAIALIIWSFYRAVFQNSLPIWFDELIAKPLVFLMPVYWFAKNYKKRPFIEIVGFKKKQSKGDILFGLAVGLAFILMAFAVRYMKTGRLFVPAVSPEGIIWIVSSLAAAAVEQMLSTGFVFRGLLLESKNVLRPLLTSAILFSFLHVPALFGGAKINGGILLSTLVLNLILSFTVSVSYALRKNTTVPIIIHALYLLSLPVLF